MTIIYTVGSQEPLPRYPNGKIIDDGTVVILDEYPDCSGDGHCECYALTHDRATYDVNMAYGDGNANWRYLCEQCWEMYKDKYEPLGWGRAQRIVSTGPKKVIRTEIGYRRD